MLAGSIPFNKLYTSHWPKSCYMAIVRVKEAWEGRCFIKDIFDS